MARAVIVVQSKFSPRATARIAYSSSARLASFRMYPSAREFSATRM